MNIVANSPRAVGCRAEGKVPSREPTVSVPSPSPSSRRAFVLRSLNVGILGAMFTWGNTARPDGLGIQDYGGTA